MKTQELWQCAHLFEEPTDVFKLHHALGFGESGAADLTSALRQVMATSSALPVDVSRWVIIYPIYINSKKTLAEGRRICNSRGVENPNIEEIRDCCDYLKIPCVLEPHKAYSRDFLQPGRVRVQLKREDGVPTNPAIASRKALMLRVAELIPKHHSRVKKVADGPSNAGASSTSGKAGKGGRKKK